MPGNMVVWGWIPGLPSLRVGSIAMGGGEGASVYLKGWGDT